MTKKPESKSYIKISKKDMITISIRAKKNILKRYENEEKPVYFELINTKDDTGVGTLYFVDHNYDGQRFDATKEVCDKAADKIVDEVFDDFNNGSNVPVGTTTENESDHEYEFSSVGGDILNRRPISEIPAFETFYVGNVKFIKIAAGKTNVRTVVIDAANPSLNGQTLTSYINKNFKDHIDSKSAAKLGIYSCVYGTSVATDYPIFVLRDSDNDLK